MINAGDIKAFSSPKILSVKKAAQLINNLKKSGKTVGLCNGGFDLLHPGHIKHCQSAKKLCDTLVISVTSDRYTSERKGVGRPIFTEKLRAYMIANLVSVDYVVITDMKGIDAITTLKPTYYIKGPDFVNKTTPGITSEREAITKLGGEIKYTTDPKFSTTGIIEYIRNNK